MPRRAPRSPFAAIDGPASISVCGIGASAGGIEALQQFFREVPADLGLAYVVVVHLARGTPRESD
jgi:two-component system, chemotaxis family, CheB/CheR fusion protein